MQKILIAVTVALMVVTVPHAFEDFQYGDLVRIGINMPLGISALGTAYILQMIGILLVVRGEPRGALLLAGLGGIWCVGAIVIHGHDMLFAGPQYRHGAISKILELLIIMLGASSAVIGLQIARRRNL